MPSRVRSAPVERQAAAFRQLLLSALQGASSARLSLPASPIAMQQQQKTIRMISSLQLNTGISLEVVEEMAWSLHINVNVLVEGGDQGGAMVAKMYQGRLWQACIIYNQNWLYVVATRLWSGLNISCCAA